MCMNGYFMKEAFLFNGDSGIVGIYSGFTSFSIPEALRQDTGSNHVGNKSGCKMVHHHTENAHQASFRISYHSNFQLSIPHHTHHCKYSPCSDPHFSFIPCTGPPLTDSTQSSIDTHTPSYPFPSPSSTLFIPLCPHSPTHIYTRFLYPFDLIHAGSSTHTHQTCPLTHFRPSPIIAFSHSTPQSYPYSCNAKQCIHSLRRRWNP